MPWASLDRLVEAGEKGAGTLNAERSVLNGEWGAWWWGLGLKDPKGMPSKLRMEVP